MAFLLRWLLDLQQVKLNLKEQKMLRRICPWAVLICNLFFRFESLMNDNYFIEEEFTLINLLKDLYKAIEVMRL